MAGGVRRLVSTDTGCAMSLDIFSEIRYKFF